MFYFRIVPGLFLALALVPFLACPASAQQDPKGIAPPAGQIQLLTVTAKGEQVYVSQATMTDPGHFEWVLLEPKATLFDAKGKRVGRHTKGPTWEIAGSKVTGRKLQAQPAPGTIPWLLLEVTQHKGPDDGVLSTTEFVQRTDTSGGAVPTDAPGKPGLKRAVPYTATYIFWGRIDPQTHMRVLRDIAALKTRNVRILEAALSDLNDLGPKAREAVPALKELSTQREDLRPSIMRVLIAIEDR